MKEEIIEIIQSSLTFLCESRNEKELQDILASHLESKSRHTLSSPNYSDVEIDIYGENYAIEVKYNQNFYSGFSQLIAQRVLYDISNLYLLHLHEYLDKKFRTSFNKLAKALNITGLLIDKRNQELMVVK